MLTEKEINSLKEYFKEINDTIKRTNQNEPVCLAELQELTRMINFKKGILSRLEESTAKSILGIFLFVDKFVKVINEKY